MMLIQVINEYQFMGSQGKFPPIMCAMDADHPQLACNLDKNDDVYMYCLACSYKLRPGIALYNAMLDRVKGLK